ncbi:MAG: MerR family transcriptional regulator [Catenulispora sp.]|nr:MerR family transcriptional regulator [Catenulispora sp.]
MSAHPAEWTIDRLARLTAAALATGTLAPQPNARIREVPDVRTIRYYTSIGLLDRPAAMRGRTALYGRRHLAQLVAIKRLQAEGLTLTEVQRRLLGADAETVERIAVLPADLGGLEADAAEFAGAGSTAGASDADDSSPDSTGTSSPASAGASSETVADAAGAAFPSTGSPLQGPVIATEAPTRHQRFWSARPEPLAAAADSATNVYAPPLVSGIRLSSDVTLLLSSSAGRVPDAGERSAIAEAAGPLLELLHRLGLSEA